MNLRILLLIAIVIAAAGMSIWMALVWSANGGPLWATALGPVLLALYLVVRWKQGR
ncbi:MAG: hypothetical protein WBO29_07770 [Albidovulum sp.]